jgi:hypothetical protein
MVKAAIIVEFGLVHYDFIGDDCTLDFGRVFQGCDQVRSGQQKATFGPVHGKVMGPPRAFALGYIDLQALRFLGGISQNRATVNSDIALHEDEAIVILRC